MGFVLVSSSLIQLLLQSSQTDFTTTFAGRVLYECSSVPEGRMMVRV
jgi:hypothetical protein